MAIKGSVRFFDQDYVSKFLSLGVWYDRDARYERLLVPCGQCWGCRLQQSREWAVRCVHEASFHKQNCFLTLTYDNAYLPENGSLVKKHLQDFWKRLRKYVGERRIRYYACGEYGSQLLRPHYHAIVFNWWPDDALLFSFRGRTRFFVSSVLCRLWPYGFHTVSDVTYNSAAYVARYVLKKITGDAASEHYGDRIPEFTVMSRKPGIGFDWILTYPGDVYPADFVVINNKMKLKPPRYYDNIYDLYYGTLDQIKQMRKEKGRGKVLDLNKLAYNENYKIVEIKKRKKRTYEE